VTDFAGRLLRWFEREGRHDLPWQVTDPYIRWLAEIMLQQTTVTAVIPYFLRFVARFPSIEVLAQAPLDDVLALWAGLGYYARARNLHATAQRVLSHHGAVFPHTFPELIALPGIGPSTAGAIQAFAFGLPAPILDANVRRVLSRYHAVTGRDAEATRTLWAHARAHTPAVDVASYTQAIMDLGALVCRKIPECARCPVAAGCLYDGTEVPLLKKPAKPERATVMAIIQNPLGEVLLMRRPPAGVWGGLWSLPECPTLADLPALLTQLGLDGRPAAPRPGVRQVFTHFILSITPVPIALDMMVPRVAEDEQRMWYKRPRTLPGMPAAVSRLLNQEMEVA